MLQFFQYVMFKTLSLIHAVKTPWTVLHVYTMFMLLRSGASAQSFIIAG